MTVEEAERLDHFYCEGCSAEGQKSLQNSHSATRSDTKVFLFRLFVCLSLCTALHAI